MCLLVGVEAGCSDEGTLDQDLGGDCAHLPHGRRRELDALRQKCEGGQQEEGHDRDEGEQVDVAQL